MDAIQDPRERASVEGMINNFGQTPTQLLKVSFKGVGISRDRVGMKIQDASIARRIYQYLWPDPHPSCSKWVSRVSVSPGIGVGW